MAAVSQNGLVANGKLSPPRFPLGVVGGSVTASGYGFEASEEDIDVDDKVEDLMRYDQTGLIGYTKQRLAIPGRKHDFDSETFSR